MELIEQGVQRALDRPNALRVTAETSDTPFGVKFPSVCCDDDIEGTTWELGEGGDSASEQTDGAQSSITLTSTPSDKLPPPRTSPRTSGDDRRTTARFEHDEAEDADGSHDTVRLSGQTLCSRGTSRPGRRLSSFKSEANPKDSTRAAYEQALTMLEPSTVPMIGLASRLME